MKLIIKPGDKLSAEVEMRLENGRLGYKRLPFIIIQNYDGKVLAITDQRKVDDEGVIFRAYELCELRDIKPNDDDKLEVQVSK